MLCGRLVSKCSSGASHHSSRRRRTTPEKRLSFRQEYERKAAAGRLYHSVHFERMAAIGAKPSTVSAVGNRPATARPPRDVTARFEADHFRLAHLRFPLMMG